MTVEPTARYMLKLVADRRGWTIHKDIAGNCSDTFVRGDDRIVVHYDEVYQSVIWAEQHYGDKTTLTKKSLSNCSRCPPPRRLSLPPPKPDRGSASKTYPKACSSSLAGQFMSAGQFGEHPDCETE